MQGGERTQTLDESLLTDTEERDQPFVEFVGSTPGRMALIAIALIATVLAVGVTASTTIADREIGEIMRLHTEPLADAAQRIYGALSIANTAATTAPVRRHRTAGRSRSLRRGDRPSVGRSGHCLERRGAQRRSLAHAAHGSLEPARRLHRDDRHRPRQQSCGTADWSRVSERGVRADAAGDSPSAEQLYRTQADAVASSERSAGPFRAVTAASLFTLGVLVLAQVYLARRSHRRLNPGLALASVLMAVLAVWLTVAGLLSVRAASDARTKGAEPLGTAVTARILAQQARADETLGLLKRDSNTQSDSFDARTAELSQLLDRHPVDGAVDALAGWVVT